MVVPRPESWTRDASGRSGIRSPTSTGSLKAGSKLGSAEPHVAAAASAAAGEPALTLDRVIGQVMTWPLGVLVSAVLLLV